MSNHLEDRRLVRRLRRACSRALPFRWRDWWRQRSRRSDNGAVVRVVMRAALSVAIAFGGMLAAVQVLAPQLLTLAGLMMMHLRIELIRHRLGSDPALAVLAQLPVPSRRIVDLQMRPVWRASLWLGLDAAGFWMVAWLSQGVAVEWWLLPVIGAAHAAVTLALALAVVLLGRTPPLWWVPIIAIALAWCLVKADTGMAWAWPAIQPVLQALRVGTPWGWLGLAAELGPRDALAAGAGLGSCLVLAVASIIVLRDRLRSTWRLDPSWREVAGRPGHHFSWDDDVIADADEDSDGPKLAGGGPTRADTQGQTESRVALAWQAARTAPSGLSLDGLGWVGRRVASRLATKERFLADRLSPVRVDEAVWRWALLMAGLSAASALAGIAGYWSLFLLAAILLARRQRGLSVLSALIGIIAIRWTVWEPIVSAVLPVIAILMVTPIAGGTWGGLPMGWTLLGNMPRCWLTLVRIMVTVIGFRFVASIPIVATAIFAMCISVSPTAGGLAAIGWLICILSAPWIIPLQLIRRTPGGLADVGHGRGWLTFLGVTLLIVQFLLMVFLLVAVAVGADSGWITFLAMVGGAIVASGVVTVLQVALLRLAYRRYVDLQ